MTPQPNNPDNFLIEVTPEMMNELNQMFMGVDEEAYEVLHYSPYWKRNKPSTTGEEK